MPTNQHKNENSGENLKRGLDNRHVQLIAIGGAIGTGLFMGSGKSISIAGPSIIFIYAIIGFMLFFVMRAMGELLLASKERQSFIDLSTDFLGPKIGFFLGWTYWLCWIVTAIADIIAITGYVHFWYPNLYGLFSAVASIALFFILNMVAVKLFGELEFWFAFVKIVAIFILIIVGFYMVMVGFDSPTHQHASFANVWNGGDLFPKGVLGFLGGFQIAVFSFVGIELVGVAAAEVKNPEYTLPKAINSVPVRIILFYILSLFIIMSVTPWYDISPEKSPFVQMFSLAGIPLAASIVNFVVLVSAASAANSGVFSTSRILYNLAEKKGAWSFLGRLTASSVPLNALTFSCISILGAYIVISLIPSIIAAFTVITTISAILFMFVWSVILVNYIVYRRKCPDLHEKSIYKMPGGVTMCYFVLAFFAFIMVLLTLEEDTRMALFSAPIWFAILGLLYYLFGRKSYKK